MRGLQAVQDTAYAALRRLGVRGGDSLAIFGQGPVGLAATQLAAAMGARVIALDLSQERLRLAREMGAEATVDSSATDPVGAIQELTGGQGTDLAMDAPGAADARHAALDSLRPWGTLALVGVGGTFSPDVGRYMQRQQTVFGSFTFSTVGQADRADFAVSRGVAIDGSSPIPGALTRLIPPTERRTPRWPERASSCSDAAAAPST